MVPGEDKIRSGGLLNGIKKYNIYAGPQNHCFLTFNLYKIINKENLTDMDL